MDDECFNATLERGCEAKILRASRSFESPPTNVPILMSNPSTRLGALAGQWDVPDPDALKTLLRPESEIEKRFYDSRLLASEQESSGDRSISENGDAEEQRTATAAFEIYQDESGSFRWRLQTEDGAVLANSGSTYPTRTACRRAVDQVRDLSPEASVKERP